jgi:type III pantothenate kinase
MSFLAIDIGNTRLKWAQYAAPQPGAALLAHGAVFLETIDDLAEVEWRDLAPPAAMLGCNVAGDAVRRRVEEQLELWDLQPRWVVPSVQDGGVVNGYEHPGRLGADRWVALIGARAHVLASQAPRPALVVMVGTAVTVDSLDTEGRLAVSSCPASASCSGRWSRARQASRCPLGTSSTSLATRATRS